MIEFLQTPPGIAAIAAAALLFLIGVVLLLRGRSSRPAISEDEDESELLPAAASKPPVKKPAAAAPEAPSSASLFRRLANGLSSTKGRMVGRIDELFGGRPLIDEQLWNDLEELLITSDVGVGTTTKLLEEMKRRAAKEELSDPSILKGHLRAVISDILSQNVGGIVTPSPGVGPKVILVVGVNGAGKTTTIGKLSARYKAAGHKVIIGAGDTFRAAAIEQVVVWGKRAGAEVVKHQEGSDPAAVAHDAVKAGIARDAGVVICDTAGRLHTKSNLMEELSKVARVVGKVLPGAPHEVLLVLDATSGQNAIAQAREFSQAVGVTGIALTKLDGTARGGVIIGVASEIGIPVKLIGIGEAVDDLRDFEPDLFVSALFDGEAGFGRGGSSADAAAADQAAGIDTRGADEAPA